MTLFMLGHDNRHAVLAERFQHSTETINRNIHKIIAGLCEFGRKIIRPRDQDEVHPTIQQDSRFFPWFQVLIHHNPPSIYEIIINTIEANRSIYNSNLV